MSKKKFVFHIVGSFISQSVIKWNINKYGNQGF